MLPDGTTETKMARYEEMSEAISLHTVNEMLKERIAKPTVVDSLSIYWDLLNCLLHIRSSWKVLFSVEINYFGLISFHAKHFF